MNLMSPESILLLLVGFQLKHFICDGVLQSAGMVQAKGHYGRPLGMAHAGVHGAGTLVLGLIFTVNLPLAMLLAAVDMVIHYHIDFGKETVVRLQGWTTKDAKFWWALSADQALHQLTYIALVWLLIKNA